MDNKINISFIIAIATAVMFLLGVPLLGPVKVHAAESSSIPYINPGSLVFTASLQPPFASLNGYQSNYFAESDSYGVYYYEDPNNNLRYNYQIFFNVGSAPVVSASNGVYATTGQYTKEFDGVVYNVYYCRTMSQQSRNNYFKNQQGEGTMDYDFIYNGTFVNHKIDTLADYQSIINYFLFGEGDIDYVKPPEDIADSDLDIHGLNCVVLNDQQASLQVGETLKNIWDRNVSAWYSAIFDSPKDYISKGIENTGTQFIKNYVPGVSLLWDSPPVVDQSEALIVENPVLYTIWIDGKTDIKYNSAADVIKNFFSGTSVGSCSYAKLLIHDGSIVSNPYHTYYYNTNQGLETILDYISNNTQFTRPTEYDQYQNICATTTISRIYIQAHQTDPETGDNRYGAITYVDLSNGIPTVYEGVTEDNIDDIPASDPDDGATTDTSQPFTVSGNDLVYDDPVHKANVGEPGGGGLIVPPSGFLSAGLALIQAVLELIKMWFLLKLVPILTLGFTGHI